MYTAITQEDLDLVSQSILDFAVKIEVLNDNGTVLEELNNIIGAGSLTIDSTSRMRRNFSATLQLDVLTKTISESSLVWLDKTLILYIGVKNMRTQEWKWYKQGRFIYNSVSTTFDASTNQMTITCNDFMNKLDGTKNGQIGGTILITIPVSTTTGGVTKYNILRDVLINSITQLGGVTNYMIDDIGEYKGTTYNPDYAYYRALHPEWNYVPYDLEFDGATKVGDIIETIVGLYPNYDAYFNSDGIFVCEMKPSGDDEPISIRDDQIKEIFISESSTTSMVGVRNICEVWGQQFDVDRYASTSTMTSAAYAITLTSYTAYTSGDIIGFNAISTNLAGATLNVNGLGAIAIYNENTDVLISAGDIVAGQDYVVKYKSALVSGSTVKKFYLMGQYQVHAINVLTDGTVGALYTHTDGTTSHLYDINYFKKKYNCKTVSLTVIPESPFTVQKLGEIIDVKSGDDYDNATSDSTALGWAEYVNWQNCRLPDSVTIVTQICPFIYENMVIEYIPENYTTANKYLVSAISHDFASGQSAWTLVRYYQLYQ